MPLRFDIRFKKGRKKKQFVKRRARTRVDRVKETTLSALPAVLMSHTHFFITFVYYPKHMLVGGVSVNTVNRHSVNIISNLICIYAVNKCKAI